VSPRLAGWQVVAVLAMLFAAVGGGLWMILRGIADEGDARDSVTARYQAEHELQAAAERFAADPGPDPAARVAVLERVAAIDPSFAPAHRELGRWRLAAGDTAAAEADLRQALILEPFDGPAMLLLGDMMAARGRTEDARGWFQKTLLYPGGDSLLAARARSSLASLPAAR